MSKNVLQHSSYRYSISTNQHYLTPGITEQSAVEEEGEKATEVEKTREVETYAFSYTHIHLLIESTKQIISIPTW